MEQRGGIVGTRDAAAIRESLKAHRSVLYECFSRDKRELLEKLDELQEEGEWFAARTEEGESRRGIVKWRDKLLDLAKEIRAAKRKCPLEALVRDLMGRASGVMWSSGAQGSAALEVDFAKVMNRGEAIAKELRNGASEHEMLEHAGRWAAQANAFIKRGVEP